EEIKDTVKQHNDNNLWVVWKMQVEAAEKEMTLKQFDKDSFIKHYGLERTLSDIYSAEERFRIAFTKHETKEKRSIK
ncbi:MAG: hypothetical protein Q7U71_02595, partial [bacterium]|nr:hypothetical protein [bacterium]